MGRKRKSSPPPGVEAFLEVVMLVPANAELIEFESRWSEIIEQDQLGVLRLVEDHIAKVSESIGIEAYQSYDGVVQIAQLAYEAKALASCLEGLPLQFVDYIGFRDQFYNEAHSIAVRELKPISKRRSLTGYRSEPVKFSSRFEKLRDQIRAATDRYEKAREWFLALYALADLIQFQAINTDDRKREFGSGFNLDRTVHLDLVDGRIAFRDEFVSAFNNVEAARIRICGKCDKVFWAKRLDMKGCTSTCSAALRTQKWREKTTDLQRQTYKVNRIAKQLREEKK